jgi:hypothetical protein
MKLAELMEQATVTLTPGDYLVANTEAVGYLPTHKDTSDLHRGQNLFKIVGIGAPDGVTGLYDVMHIIPVNLSLDGKSYVEDTENPIVIVEAGAVTYKTTRNDPLYRDVYHGGDFHRVEGIAAGAEGRHAIAAFVAFADSHYSLGVNHFQVEGPDYLDATV